ncbi:MAG: hypothetical protein ABIE43_03180 [Patescibacteria group bacterium]
MGNIKKIIIIFLFTVLFLVLILLALIYFFWNKQMSELPEYYKKAAKEDCGYMDVVIHPINCCFDTLNYAVEQNFPIPIKGKCPKGYTALGIGCGWGPGICK